MNRTSAFVKIIGIVAVLGLSLVVTVSLMARPNRGTEAEKSVRITLSVYSGRPNPEWQLTPGPEYDHLIRLIEALDTSEKALFDYDEWNRLGYASFWVALGNVEGLPYAIHVWRDMAYVAQDREGKALYALGAAEIYDLLVAQAEKRDLGDFFVNYHKYREELAP